MMSENTYIDLQKIGSLHASRFKADSKLLHRGVRVLIFSNSTEMSSEGSSSFVTRKKMSFP